MMNQTSRRQGLLDQHTIRNWKGAILKFLIQSQQPNGEFQSLESYRGAEDVWNYVAPSPFIHANILIALMAVKEPEALELIERGATFIEKLKEDCGLWRFWPHSDQTHPVPIDVDDTALCSFLLKKRGKSLNNRAYLENNRNKAGYFLTWILPKINRRYFSPTSNYLRKDFKVILPTLNSPMLAADDFEPAVAANVLLYLGEGEKTKKCADLIHQQLQNLETLPLQYYSNPLITFYHLSRAYEHGFNSLHVIGQYFRQCMDNQLIKSPESKLELCWLLLTLHNFELFDLRQDQVLFEQFLAAYPVQDQWKPEVYFVSKDRNFRAGSPALTAALYLEVLEKYSGCFYSIES